MDITFDPNKDATNFDKHGIRLADAVVFEWGTSISWEDNREDYGEQRYNALGYIGFSLYHLTYSYREESCRVISLRKATLKEENRYAST